MMRKLSSALISKKSINFLMFKRLFDISLSFLLIILFALPMLLISILIKFSSPGGILFWSKRVGKNNALFSMPKFRSMSINTPVIATHQLNNPQEHITRLGEVLRRFSIDELPQLFSIFLGDMSFVGPRPALYNQHDLIALRDKYGVSKIKPGLTGWAQINGRDSLSIKQKVEFDVYYLTRMSIILDIKIILFTFVKVYTSKNISH